MKKNTFLFLFFFQMLVFSQTQDLAKLASGDYLGFNALFDKDSNLFGYISMYNYGKSGAITKKFEYVVLDKNLNPIANKEFQGEAFIANYVGYIDFNNKIILKPSEFDVSGVKMKEITTPRSKEIDLSNNTIKDKDYFKYNQGKMIQINEPENWKQVMKEDRLEKRDKGYNYRSYVYEIKEGGYLAIEYNDYGTYINNNNLIKLDDNKKEVWRFRYNTSGDKKINEQVTLLEKDENYVYLLNQKNEKKRKDFELLVLDMKTGKEIHRKAITSLGSNTLDLISSFNTFSYGSITNDKTFDDKIVLVGRDLDDKNKYTGFARMVIDRKTFAVQTNIISYQSLKRDNLQVSENGGVEGDYFLDPRDLYILKDGSVGILLEKYKPAGAYSAPKTTDMVYVFTDKNFEAKGVKVFEKEKTKWANNDYLFSQYLNNGNDVVFFFRDYQKDNTTKEKNWNLFINTVIDGNFKQEMIPISSKDNFFIQPYVGKEGYILLREYNDKEKFNKVRLERLNY